MQSSDDCRRCNLSLGGVRFLLSWERRYDDEIDLLLRHLSPFMVTARNDAESRWHLRLARSSGKNLVRTEFCQIDAREHRTIRASLRRSTVLRFSIGSSRPRYDVQRGAFVLKREWLDYGLTLGLAEAGYAIAHGAAVARHGSAVLFVGPDGAGKTTAARTLQRRTSDAALIADNYVPVTATNCLAYPGAPRVGFVGAVPTYDFAHLADQARHASSEIKISAVINVGGHTDSFIDATHTPVSSGPFQTLAQSAGVSLKSVPSLDQQIPVLSYDYKTDDLSDLVSQVWTG